MASSALQLMGFVLSLGGLGATIAATCMVTWKRLESNTSVRQTYQGLWMTCSGFNNRETSCELHESLFDLPIEVQVTRAVMMFSIFLASVGVLVSTVGMKCTRFLDGSDKTKNSVAMAGGIMFMLSGVLTLAITSWYVRKIVQTFYGAHHNNRYEFGNAVFTSWAGAVLMMTGGVFLSCRRCSHSRPLVNLPKLRPKLQPTLNSGTDYV